MAFCAHTIKSDDIMEVRDATPDERFTRNRSVTGPAGVRSYAGAPMVAADGMRLGSVCVLDTVPGELDEGQRAALDGLSRLAVNQLERHRAAIELREALERVRTMARVTLRELELRKTSRELAESLRRAAVLEEVVPLCPTCRRVREDDEYRESLSMYIARNTGSLMSQGICPECAEREFSDLDEDG